MISKNKRLKRKDLIKRIIEITNNESETKNVLEAQYFLFLSDLLLYGRSYLPFIGVVKIFSVKKRNADGVRCSLSIDSELRKLYKRVKEKGFDNNLINSVVEEYLLSLKEVLMK